MAFKLFVTTQNGSYGVTYVSPDGRKDFDQAVLLLGKIPVSVRRFHFLPPLLGATDVGVMEAKVAASRAMGFRDIGEVSQFYGHLVPGAPAPAPAA